MAAELNGADAPRLSIVIPAAADTASMEETLVSVLENRPDDCEIVVALGCEYADPWNIREEVRFVQAPEGSSLVACVNLGVAASRGGIVHILGAGWRATEGWTEAPLARFENDDVAAVVPVGVAADDRQRVVSAGVRYAAGGRRIDVAAESGRRRGRQGAAAAQGPVLEAGFWRAEALALAGRGFTTACGPGCADVDMAVTVARSRREVAFEPQSVVVAPAAGGADRAVGGFAEGLYAERLFWRSVAGCAPLSAAVLHVVEIVRHAVAVAPLGSIPMLVGRAVAILQFGGFLTRYLQLSRVVRQASVARREPEPADRQVIRIDGPHAGLGRPRRAEPTVLRKSA